MARRRAPLAACILTIAELFLFTFDYNAVVDRRYYVPPLPIVDALRRAAPSTPFRVLGLDWVLLPNAAEQYQLEDVRGSDPLEWREYPAGGQRSSVRMAYSSASSCRRAPRESSCGIGRGRFMEHCRSHSPV